MSIHSGQDKNNCFMSVGDIVKITLKSRCGGGVYVGKISYIEIRKQTGTDCDGYHTVLDLYECVDGLYGFDIPPEKRTYCQESFWLENIEEIEVLEFGDGAY